MFIERGTTAHLAWARTRPEIDLMLLHGFSDSADCWTPLLPALSRWGVLATDARGHGRSGLPIGPRDSAAHAADAELVLTALALAPVVVIGHSMGASAAARLAVKRPDLVRALVLEDPPDGLSPPTSAAPVMPDSLRAARDLDRAERIAAVRADEPGWAEDELAPWAIAKEQVDPRLFDQPYPAPVPLADLLDQVRCPILLMHGDAERGSRVTPETARAYAATAGSPRLVHVAGAGHCVRRDRPERYAAELARFLDALG